MQGGEYLRVGLLLTVGGEGHTHRMLHYFRQEGKTLWTRIETLEIEI